MPPAFLTTPAVARLLGVSIRRVQALIHAGRLPAVKYGRDWVIAETDVALIRTRPTGRPKRSSLPYDAESHP